MGAGKENCKETNVKYVRADYGFDALFRIFSVIFSRLPNLCWRDISSVVPHIYHHKQNPQRSTPKRQFHNILKLSSIKFVPCQNQSQLLIDVQQTNIRQTLLAYIKYSGPAAILKVNVVFNTKLLKPLVSIINCKFACTVTIQVAPVLQHFLASLVTKK